MLTASACFPALESCTRQIITRRLHDTTRLQRLLKISPTGCFFSHLIAQCHCALCTRDVSELRRHGGLEQQGAGVAEAMSNAMGRQQRYKQRGDGSAHHRSCSRPTATSTAMHYMYYSSVLVCSGES